MSTPQALHIPADGGVFFKILGIPTLARLSAAETGNTCIMSEQIVPPGLGVPPHIHTREDEIFEVLEGHVEFLAGDKLVTAKAGDVVFGPRNVAHSYTAIGENPARVRFIAIPGDIEAMFGEMATWPQDGPPDFPKLVELCGKFGITFV